MSDSEQPNLGGRPRVYTDPEVFAARVQAYFDSLEENNKRPTFAGISYFLGFEDRESFTNYANLDGFSRTVKQARLLIEDDRWQSLIDKNAFTPGLIFDLKNNHGWKDKTEQDINLSSHEDALDRLK